MYGIGFEANRLHAVIHSIDNNSIHTYTLPHRCLIYIGSVSLCVHIFACFFWFCLFLFFSSLSCLFCLESVRCVTLHGVFVFCYFAVLSLLSTLYVIFFVSFFIVFILTDTLQRYRFMCFRWSFVIGFFFVASFLFNFTVACIQTNATTSISSLSD